MRIFISWSGESSRLIAEALRDWIPYVLPEAQPWMSATDIDRGARWGNEISFQLQSANIGIICLTPENLDAPWILFEAGALSKLATASLVCTYLYQVNPASLRGPLHQFQATIANKEDTKSLICSINRVRSTGSVEQARLDRIFDKWWPELETALSPAAKLQATKQMSEREMLQEILHIVLGTDTRSEKCEVAILPGAQEFTKTFTTEARPQGRNAIDSLQTQYIFLTNHLNDYQASMQTDAQKSSFVSAYVGCRKNYWNCINRTFNDESPDVRALVEKMSLAQEALHTSLRRLNNTNAVIEVVTSAVKVGEQLATLGR